MLHVNKGLPNQHYSRFLHVKSHEHYAHRKHNSLQLQLAQGWKMCKCPRKISFCDLFIRHLVPPLAHGDSMHITLMYVTQKNKYLHKYWGLLPIYVNLNNLRMTQNQAYRGFRSDNRWANGKRRKPNPKRRENKSNQTEKQFCNQQQFTCMFSGELTLKVQPYFHWHMPQLQSAWLHLWHSGQKFCWPVE